MFVREFSRRERGRVALLLWAYLLGAAGRSESAAGAVVLTNR